MPFYHKLGTIPPKRHTQFRNEKGELYSEELVSSEGFSGVYSNLYHEHTPTQIKEVRTPLHLTIKAVEGLLEPIHLNTSQTGVTGTDFMEARVPLLYNKELVIGICHLGKTRSDYYYKNGEADEMYYIHDGEGVFYTQFGVLPFKKGDYVIIPRTTIYQLETKGELNRLLYMESFSPIETVKRYRNDLGQLLEHSPYCERDIHPPKEIYIDGKRDVNILVKKQGYLHSFIYSKSPFDVVGWDGFLFPYTFSIYDFEPITGRIHQPPPAHQTFQGGGYVVCSFVPRLFDYHPLAIPAPYNHSNIDSDEVLFYAEGEFMSRKGISRGSFTLHPGGLPHGPHPGTVEKSIGAKETNEYAVMIDTFRPLFLTEQALSFADKNYPYTWLVD